jgi:TolA-binding protein
MKTWLGRIRPVKVATMSALAVVLVGNSLPAFAQDTLAEARIRKMEAEIRALQRQVFPGSSGDKLFAPEITPGQPAAPSNTSPTSTPVSDLLTRMDTVESQLARLTSQIEQTSNRLSILEARSAVGTADAAAATAATTPAPAGPAAADSNLSAMTGGASTPKPATVPLAAPAAKPAATPAPTSARPTPAPAAARPTAQRLAAVQAIQKPATNDPGDDEYSYGFRLWEAKFYPEAQQQLKMMVERYPRHAKISFARNLLGRAYLDEGKPREAATWFLQNYQGDKTGARASDSLLLLAESMRQLKDTSRACIALSEFADTYAAEAAGRLKSQYDATRAGVKCTK